MKVLIAANSKAESWFRSSDPEEIQLMAEGLDSKALLGVTREQLAGFTNLAVFDLLISSMSAVALIGEPDVCDIIQGADKSIPSLVRTDDFLKWQNIRCREPEDETSEDLFYRKFEKLALVGKQIDFIDQYFWSNLSNPGKGAFFLLNKFLAESSIKIRIYASVANTSYENRVAEENLRALVAKHNRSNCVEVHLFKNRAGKPFLHDRISRIVFEKGSIGFTAGHGSELFGRRRVPVGGVLTEVKVVFDKVTQSLRSVDSEPRVISV
jgi:hypothetical protein